MRIKLSLELDTLQLFVINSSLFTNIKRKPGRGGGGVLRMGIRFWLVPFFALGPTSEILVSFFPEKL